jgi:hypothetical protein
VRADATPALLDGLTDAATTEADVCERGREMHGRFPTLTCHVVPMQATPLARLRRRCTLEQLRRFLYARRADPSRCAPDGGWGPHVPRDSRSGTPVVVEERLLLVNTLLGLYREGLALGTLRAPYEQRAHEDPA